MPSHYYSSNQDSKLSLKETKVTARSIVLKIVTSSGVFSKKGIDKGSLLLIERMIIHPGWEILDLGCGYGAIGLFAAKLSGSRVYLVDINERACDIAWMNAKLNKINVIVLNGDIYSPVADKKFDTILINPPQSAGKKVCFKMIEQSKKHLNKDGLLQLVARPNKGGRTLSAKMRDVFGNLEIIAKDYGYAVYISKNL